MTTKPSKAAGTQAKVKNAVSKVGGLVKANAVVAVASGKVLAVGLKEIGAAYVADSRKAVVVLKDDFKAIAKVKTAPELMRLQREQTLRNVKAISSVAAKNVVELRKLVAGKVAPMVTERVKANLDLFRKAA